MPSVIQGDIEFIKRSKWRSNWLKAICSVFFF